MDWFTNLLDWFAGGRGASGAWRYMRLDHCFNHDTLWITITVALDLIVAAGYGVIAMHWWKNQRTLPDVPAKRALGNMRNIFLFCGICGYVFIPIKMFYPAWRLYDLFMAVLVYFTWKYAWNAKDLKVVYSELGRSTQLAEDLARTKEESRKKTFFLNAVSHDLRTPLNGLMLQANLAELSAKNDDKETLQASVDEIKSCARMTADLLESLLEYARLEWNGDRNNVTTFKLKGLVDDIFASQQAAADEKGITLRSNVSADAIVRTDRVKLERILTNLVNNAIKFTRQGGVKIEADVATDSAAEIHVIDSGVGIAPEHRERLFEEFFQVHNHERDRKKGFGLGLAIARQLARQLGGDINIESAVGRGSRLSVLLAGNPAGAANEDGNGQTPAVLAAQPSAAGIDC